MGRKITNYHTIAVSNDSMNTSLHKMDEYINEHLPDWQPYGELIINTRDTQWFLVQVMVKYAEEEIEL